MEHLYGVYGSSGFGREVMPLLREALASTGVPSERLVFIDDNPREQSSNGHSILSYDAFLRTEASARSVTLAIANSAVREKLTARCQADGIIFFHTQASNVVLLDKVKIEEGAILCPFFSITSNVSIGRQFHGNIYGYIAHDCIIGDYVTFAPGVKCNGNIRIEDHAYIGTGAIIKQGSPEKPLTIGKGAVVGMGAVVTKDVPPGVTVVGNPARPFQK